MDIDKLAILAAFLAPAAIALAFLIQERLASGGGIPELARFVGPITSATIGAALAVYLLVPYVWDHRSRINEVRGEPYTVAAAILISLAAALLLFFLARRLKGTLLVLLLAASPLLASIVFIGVQRLNEFEEGRLVVLPYVAQVAGVPVTNRASVELVASGLDFTTSLCSDHSGGVLVTEYRSEKIWLLEPGSDGSFEKKFFASVPLPEEMIGLEQAQWHCALDQDGKYLYVMALESRVPGLRSFATSRVVRFAYNDGEAGPLEIFLSSLPAAENHSGGAMAFGPDGNLYLSIGDGEKFRKFASSPLRLEGSILRFTPNAQVPEDNPFTGSPVFAYGFRNPYGMAFHPLTGALYATDNGTVCCDRLIRVEPGEFHGWPDFNVSPGDIPRMRKDPKVVAPLLESGVAAYGPTQLIAYGGDRYGDEFIGNLFFGTFTAGDLHRIVLSEDGTEAASDEIIYKPEEFEPIIGLTVASDGYIYFSTFDSVYRINNFQADFPR